MTSNLKEVSLLNNEKFSIHSKLLLTNTHWSYCFHILPHQENSIHEMRVSDFEEDGYEFAIYKRDGDYMILVDFFKSYEEACKEAKDILNEFPKAKGTITSLGSINKK